MVTAHLVGRNSHSIHGLAPIGHQVQTSVSSHTINTSSRSFRTVLFSDCVKQNGDPRRSQYSYEFFEKQVTQGIHQLTHRSARRSFSLFRDREYVEKSALNRSLTVVLPLHNAERYLQTAILDLFELAHEVTESMQIVVVDDASTDETYELGCEMARVYPQLTVLRQSVRRGINAALDMVRNHLAVESVVVHNGQTPIFASELKSLLEMDPTGANAQSQKEVRVEKQLDSMGSRRFSSFRSLQERMEKAHQRLLSFTWMNLEEPLIPRRSSALHIPKMGPAQGGGQVPVQITTSSTLQ